MDPHVIKLAWLKNWAIVAHFHEHHSKRSKFQEFLELCRFLHFGAGSKFSGLCLVINKCINCGLKIHAHSFPNTRSRWNVYANGGRTNRVDLCPVFQAGIDGFVPSLWQIVREEVGWPPNSSILNRRGLQCFFCGLISYFFPQKYPAEFLYISKMDRVT